MQLLKRLLRRQSYRNVLILKDTVANITDCIQDYHTRSIHYDSTAIQQIASKTARFYCILLKFHSITSISFYITVTLYRAFHNVLRVFKNL
jgi:hypothetical protein